MEYKDKYGKEVRKTRLDSGSKIYDKKRNDESNLELWNKMSRFEKFMYYKEYYLKYTIIAIIMISLISYVFYTMSRPDKKDTFFMGMIDGLQFEESIKDDMPEKFVEYLNLKDYDGYVKKDRTFFKSYYNTYVENIQIDGFYDKRRFDVFVTKESSYASLASGGIYYDLSEVLPDDLYEFVKDRLVYASLKDSDEKIPFAIKVVDTNFKFYDANNNEIKDTTISIMNNTKRLDAAILFIRFMFEKQ